MTRLTADLTVVIPTFNGFTRGFVGQAIDSVHNQSLSPLRLLVVDDGSTDGTADWLRQTYPKIEIISKANEGLPATRNFAFAQITTQYVAFLDDDDIWDPDKIKIQMSFLESHPEIDFVFCGVKYINENGKFIGQRSPAEFGHTYPQILLGNSILPPSTVIFKSDLIRRTGPFNSQLRQGEDYEFFIRCAKFGKIGFVREALVHYRQHGSQMSGSLEFIDQETYKIIATHAATDLPEIANRILRFFKYGSALRAFARRDFSGFLKNIRESPGQFDLVMLFYRTIGMFMTPFEGLKNRWRDFEYRRTLRDYGKI